MNITETNHPYYCSGGNYYSNEPNEAFESVTGFLDEYENADVDLNLCFRFDIKKREEDDEDAKENGMYYAEFFLILQRKGIFKPIYCRSYNPETESERLQQYLKKHWETVKSLWIPIA
jgi:hypothetical protein